MGRPIWMSVPSSPVLLIVFVLSTHHGTTSGIDINSFKGEMVREDDAIEVQPVDTEEIIDDTPVSEEAHVPMWTMRENKRTPATSWKPQGKFINSAGVYPTKKPAPAWMITKKPAPAWMITKKPAPAWLMNELVLPELPIDEILENSDRKKLQQFFSGNFDPDKLVQIVEDIPSVQYMTKDQLEAFKRARRGDIFIHAQGQDVQLMNGQDIQSFIQNLKLNRKPNILPGEIVGLFTRDQLNRFKNEHSNAKFIHTDDFTVMNKKQLKSFIGNEISSDSPRIIFGEIIGIFTKDQLQRFKNTNRGASFIDVDDSDVKLMNENQLKQFMGNKGGDKSPKFMFGEIVGIYTKEELEIFKKNNKGSKFIESDDFKLMNKEQLKQLFIKHSTGPNDTPSLRIGRPMRNFNPWKIISSLHMSEPDYDPYLKTDFHFIKGLVLFLKDIESNPKSSKCPSILRDIKWIREILSKKLN